MSFNDIADCFGKMKWISLNLDDSVRISPEKKWVITTIAGLFSRFCDDSIPKKCKKCSIPIKDT